MRQCRLQWAARPPSLAPNLSHCSMLTHSSAGQGVLCAPAARLLEPSHSSRLLSHSLHCSRSARRTVRSRGYSSVAGRGNVPPPSHQLADGWNRGEEEEAEFPRARTLPFSAVAKCNLTACPLPRQWRGQAVNEWALLMPGLTHGAALYCPD